MRGDRPDDWYTNYIKVPSTWKFLFAIEMQTKNKDIDTINRYVQNITLKVNKNVENNINT